jgi:hypothetical protein
MKKKNTPSISLDSFVKILPFLIVFYGFTHSAGYYQTFDIDLASFLSFDELVLNLLPIYPVVLMIFGLLLSIVLTMQLCIDKKFKVIESRFRPLYIKALLDKKFRERIKCKNILWLALYYTFFNLPLIASVAFLYLKSRTKDLDPTNTIIAKAILYLLAGIVFYHLFYLLIREAKIIKLSYSRILFGIFLILSTLYVRDFGKYWATGIIQNSTNKQVSFTYKNKAYKTDSNLVFIEHTRKYIILHNQKDSTNLFFEKENISNLITK